MPRAITVAPSARPCSGSTFRYDDVREDVEQRTPARCRASARSGRFLCGFCTSAAANVTLFHASLEKSEPTSAAPNAMTNAEVDVDGDPTKSAAREVRGDRRRRCGRREPEQDEQRERAGLDDRERGLDELPFAHAAQVDPGQHPDRDEGDEPLRREAELDRRIRRSVRAESSCGNQPYGPA